MALLIVRIRTICLFKVRHEKCRHLTRKSSSKIPSRRKISVFRKVQKRQRTVAQTGSSLMRFLGYVWPYAGLISGAVFAGILKFTLPASLAVSLRFVTDNLVPTGRAEGSHDASYAFTLSYLELGREPVARHCLAHAVGPTQHLDGHSCSSFIWFGASAFISVPIWRNWPGIA